MDNANITIRHDPHTGNKRPWEVCFEVEGRSFSVIGSCATEAAAKKSAKDAAKRNAHLYDVNLAI